MKLISTNQGLQSKTKVKALHMRIVPRATTDEQKESHTCQRIQVKSTSNYINTINRKTY